MVEAIAPDVNTTLTKLEAHLIAQNSQTFKPYYNGKMSYKLHGKHWQSYVDEAFPDLGTQQTSENIYKSVIDLYAENLVPLPSELKGFSNILVPLLSRGEAPVLVLPDDTPSFPEHYEMISDGDFTIVAIFTRSLKNMQDYITFAYTDGRTRLFAKPVPEDLSASTDYTQGFTFVEEKTGNTLFRFALDDKGFGGSLAALQDRVNHSIIDQTVVAEMYARPFWYLMNVQTPLKNPYLPAGTQVDSDAMTEQRTDGATGRIFTTSSEGPFGQLDPPTISDMIGYHDSIYDKISTATGIPQHYFKPGSGTPPTGIALKVLSKRFNNKISRMREDIKDELERLAALLGVAKEAVNKDAVDKDVMEYEFWSTEDDLLQEALDQHGINLSQMGYPLEYIASVVTPGVDLEDYQEEEGLPADGAPGEPTDMTAMGQPGLPATPGQVQSYAQNPGQRAKARS